MTLAGPALDRERLRSAKLAALVRRHFGEADRVPAELSGGAALLAGPAAWVLLDAEPARSLGRVLLWADRRGVRELHLLAEAGVGELARRASCFTPPPRVWRVESTSLAPAQAAPVPPCGGVAPPAPELARLLGDTGLGVVVEGGVMRGELRGLEVARVVHDRTSAGVPIDEPLLEVGVGRADRELTAMVHAGLSPAKRLRRVIEVVGRHRRPGAAPHPLNELAKERWLRATLLADPARIGLAELSPVGAAAPRANLRDPDVAAALGRAPDGATVVVVCSVGVNLDFVPAAADTRLALAPSARLLLVVHERDAHPLTAALARRLDPPGELVALGGEWRI